MMVRYVCKTHSTIIRVWWRCTVMDSGELCVMILLVQLRQTLYVDNWDTLDLLLMTALINPCELCYQNLYISSLTIIILNTHSQESTKPIWFDNINCSYTYSCIRSCQMCPSSENHNCGHSEDIKIECGKLAKLMIDQSCVQCVQLLECTPECFLCL